MPNFNLLIILVFLVGVITILSIFTIVKIGVAKNFDRQKIIKYEMRFLLIAYAVALFVLIVVARGRRTDGLMFFIPFEDIYEIIKNKYPWNYDNRILLNLVNVALFVPFGLLAREVFQKKKVFALLSGLFFSITLELIQLITQLGVFDVNDIIYNTLGTLAGIGIFALYTKICNKIGNKNSKV